MTYKAGKKAGLKTEEDIDQPGIADRVVKGAMKTAYKAQKCVAKGLGNTKEKYGTMWADAQEDVAHPE